MEKSFHRYATKDAKKIETFTAKNAKNAKDAYFSETVPSPAALSMNRCRSGTRLRARRKSGEGVPGLNFRLLTCT